MWHYTSPPAASPQVSWESASHSCGTCLISSVIKINEVLIAVVTHANDGEAQRQGFPLPAANQRVNLGLDVCEIEQRHSSSVAVVDNEDRDSAKPLNINPFFWSDLCPTALICIRISNLNHHWAFLLHWVGWVFFKIKFGFIFASAFSLSKTNHYKVKIMECLLQS